MRSLRDDDDLDYDEDGDEDAAAAYDSDDGGLYYAPARAARTRAAATEYAYDSELDGSSDSDD